MNTVKPSKPSSDFWNHQITKWQQTNHSQIGYCRAHNLDYHRFTYWRRKFASVMEKDDKAVRSSFVPVKTYSTYSTQSTELTATLPNGVILRGIATDNVSIVKQLLGLHS